MTLQKNNGGKKNILLSPKVVDRAKDSRAGRSAPKKSTAKNGISMDSTGFEALRPDFFWIGIFSQTENG